MAFKIYTKGGDTGETSLYGGQRAPKDDARIEAYGTVDELNAQLGVVGSLVPGVLRERIAPAEQLLRVQSELFTVGSQLATPPEKALSLKPLTEAAVVRLEAWIDELEVDLPALTAFILPAGSPAVTQCQLARCVARRAERRLVTLHRASPVDATLIRYLNRLSDYLFTLARALAHHAGEPDIPWVHE